MLVMKTICLPDYYHNVFVATLALGHNRREGTLFPWLHIYITPILLLRELSTLCVVDHLWPYSINIAIPSNTGTIDLVTWPLKCKLVESMVDIDAWFMQQGVRLIEGSTHVRLYCCRYLFEHIFTYLCIIQETNSWYAIYKIQNRTFF